MSNDVSFIEACKMISNNIPDHHLYNPKMSMLSYSITANFNGVSVSISKTLNNQQQGRPQKGDKVYDHDHKAYFTLSPEECFRIMKNISSVISGSYVNPKPFTDDHKNSLVITHYPQPNEASMMLLEPSKDSNGNITNTLRITIIPPKSQRDKSYIASYFLRPGEELSLFLSFLNNVATNLEFIGSVAKAFIKTVNKNYFDALQYQKNNPKPNNQEYQQSSIPQYQHSPNNQSSTPQYQKPQNNQPPVQQNPMPWDSNVFGLSQNDESDLPF
jgi:hypothetical protein